jgi:hypothetical protein
MRVPSGEVIFRILLVILAIELAYVGYTVFRPEGGSNTNESRASVSTAKPTAPPTPSPTGTVTASPTATPTSSPTRAASPTPTATASPTPTATPTPTPAPNAAKAFPVVNALTYVDDAAFVYEGSWQHIRGVHDGRRFGTSTRSSHAGDRATYAFHGRFTILFGMIGPGGGKADIDIDDGAERGTLDFSDRTKKPSALVYESSALPIGPHSVTITVVRGPVELDGAYYGS